MMDKNIMCIGSFDGVHLGHRSIIEKLLHEAKEEGATPRVFTFVPIPNVYFGKGKVHNLLINAEEKAYLFKQFFGLTLESFIFDEEISHLSAHKFMTDVLIHKFNAIGLVIGKSHTFGKDREGNIDWIEKNKHKYPIQFHLVDSVSIENKTINSTAIRNNLHKGNIQEANQMLGYPYTYEDIIVHGDKRGHEIGFPTANFGLTDKTRLIPAEGIYAVWVKYNNSYYKGMAYVGYRPTYNGIELRFETHILDFDKTIYGEKIRVFFYEKIRDDIKFQSVEGLILQLNDDRIKIEHALKDTKNPALF